MDRYIKRQLVAVSISVAGFLLLISAVGADFVLGRQQLAAVMAFAGVALMAGGVVEFRRVVMRRGRRRSSRSTNASRDSSHNLSG